MLSKRIIFIGILSFFVKFYSEEAKVFFNYLFFNLEDDMIRIIKNPIFYIVLLVLFLFILVRNLKKDLFEKKLKLIYNSIRTEISLYFEYNPDIEFDCIDTVNHKYQLIFRPLDNNVIDIFSKFLKFSLLFKGRNIILDLEYYFNKENRPNHKFLLMNKSSYQQKSKEYGYMFFNQDEYEFVEDVNYCLSTEKEYFFLKSRKEKKENEGVFKKVNDFIGNDHENLILFQNHICQLIYLSKTTLYFSFIIENSTIQLIERNIKMILLFSYRFGSGLNNK